MASAPTQLQAIESELSRVQKKSALRWKKTEATLDSFIADVDTLIEDLEGQVAYEKEKGSSKPAPTSSASEIKEENDDASNLQSFLKERCAKIVQKKPITAIKNIHKDYYTYLSKLGRTINESVHPGVEDIQTDFRGQEVAFVSLLKGFLKEKAASFQTDLSSPPEKLTKDTKVDSQEVKNLQERFLLELTEKLEKKDFMEAVEFLEDTEKRGEAFKKENKIPDGLSMETLIDLELKTLIFKLAFLEKVENKEIKEAILFLKTRFPEDVKKSESFEEEIGELIFMCTFENCANIPKRLEKHSLDKVFCKTLKTLHKTLRRIKNLPEQSTFEEIILAGILSIPRFLESSLNISTTSSGTELPISVPLPSEMIHHTIIYCPVTKDACIDDNKALMPDCGHIVGETSVRKMGDLKFKCPICPNVQKKGQLKAVVF